MMMSETTQSAELRLGASCVTQHLLDGHVVQRLDSQHVLVIDGDWVRLRRREYRILLPLITRFKEPVSVETLCHEAFGEAYSSADRTRLYRTIDRLRPALARYGLAVTSLNKRRGYMLWSDPALVSDTDDAR